jgi:hypothetical protein
VQTKYVRCTNGAVFDVIVDLRPESPNYLKHFSVVLSAKNGPRTIYSGTFCARLSYPRRRHRGELPHWRIPCTEVQCRFSSGADRVLDSCVRRERLDGHQVALFRRIVS